MQNYSSTFSRIFNINLDDYAKMDLYFPSIKETIVPLSFTGVSPRNFFSWKENGLIDLVQEGGEEERKWIKLNFVDFIWVKIIQTMREFGLPYELIRELKNTMLCDFESLLENSFSSFRAEYINSVSNDPYKVDELDRLFTESFSIMNDVKKSGLLTTVELTPLYMSLITILITKIKTSIVIVRKENRFLYDLIFYEKLGDLSALTQSNINYPHFEIPINCLIEEFFNEPKSEKYGSFFGFINVKEQKVLDAIRKKDFMELHIKLDNDKELIIESINDGDITNEQATQIRKFLGMSNYEEITLKYRNSKHLYFKNKKRI